MTMQQTLQAHISFLETQIAKLRKRLGSTDVEQSERDHLLKRMQLAGIALDSYRRACALERKLRG